MTLCLLAPRSTNWANLPLDINVLQINSVFAMNVCKLVKKRKQSKWKVNVVRVSLEHTTLPLLVPRSTNWANRAFDINEQEMNIFKNWINAKYLKRESNTNKKWILVRMSLEHWPLSLLAPRSTDWANRPFDTNIEQINILTAMNVRKLLKKRK